MGIGSGRGGGPQTARIDYATLRDYPLPVRLWQARVDFDLSAVRVETPGGRREYQTAQAELTQRAVPLRLRLLLCYEEALRFLEGAGDEQWPHRVETDAVSAVPAPLPRVALRA